MCLFFILKLLVYLCFIFLFTMFEFTKLIYLWRCIFIHFYFCTMYVFFPWFPFVSFLYFVCKIFMVILLLLLLQMEKHFIFLCLVIFILLLLFFKVIFWPSTCELVQNLHVDQPICVHRNRQGSILEKDRLNYHICDKSDQLPFMRNPKNDIRDSLILTVSCVKTFFSDPFIRISRLFTSFFTIGIQILSI